MTTVPKISVVVPCYNGGKFIDQLTATLARQTLHDFDILIVNDGSTDAATKAKLATLDPAIRVIHQENRGLSAARNTGFVEAKADLVLALDCDDQLEPTYLEECWAAFQSAPREVGFVFTHVRLVGGAHGIEKRYFNAFDVLFKNTLGYSMVIRKAAWLKAGKYDETMRDGYEDWEFNLRLINSGYIGIEIPKLLFLYTASTQGMLMGHSSNMHAALWRRIREKHRELYKLSNLVRLYWKCRRQRTEISIVRPIGLLLLSGILPNSWYNAVTRYVRSRRMARSNKHHAVASQKLPGQQAGAAENY